MFQIVILNKKQAKLIDTPPELQSVLNRLKLNSIFVDTEFVSDIQKVYPGVTINKLSTRPEINRYGLNSHLKELLEKARRLNLDSEQKEFLDELERVARKTGGVGKKRYGFLLKMANTKDYD